MIQAQWYFRVGATGAKINIWTWYYFLVGTSILTILLTFSSNRPVSSRSITKYLLGPIQLFSQFWLLFICSLDSSHSILFFSSLTPFEHFVALVSTSITCCIVHNFFEYGHFEFCLLYAILSFTYLVKLTTLLETEQNLTLKSVVNLTFITFLTLYYRKCRISRWSAK